ncbi:HU family DNA-binding protein [Pararhizobium sp. BT-229]|jgi:DNA-binding protein HU-beta|uniref:HU family DNA-binding protein n=1 Tax=Pararhizobium sp. BT-229 TaxID=2986923 RepID=UPI0011535426|nr:HU family DNA-binding protein [Pararhizobium sp. BT-229]MCV9965019.1 HU family DNA-binding protein [Pararhizobium sp. BT-229]
MNRTELEATICESTKVNKDVVADVVQSLIDTISDTLRSGNDVKLTGFATIKVKDCASRVGKNPKTGEAIDIPERRKVTIKAGKRLESYING